eukprot:1144750-Prymnesium_polylepis.1
MKALVTKSPPHANANSSCQNAAPPGVIVRVAATVINWMTAGDGDIALAAAVHSGGAARNAAACRSTGKREGDRMAPGRRIGRWSDRVPRRLYTFCRSLDTS